MTAAAKLSLPPSPFVREFADRPDMVDPTMVLDVGCFQGRNSFYLAERGHTVTGIDVDHDAIEQACEAAIPLLGRQALRFMRAELKTSGFPANSFGALVCTEVVNFIPRGHERTNFMLSSKSLVIPGGLHAISDYVHEPGTDNRFLRPNELLEMYQDWDVLDYREITKPMTFTAIGKPCVNSTAQLIARKPS